jgi:beta-barrel assembly-enhancing protease
MKRRLRLVLRNSVTAAVALSLGLAPAFAHVEAELVLPAHQAAVPSTSMPSFKARVMQIAQATPSAAKGFASEAPLPKAQTALPTLGAPETQDLPSLEEKRIVREIRQEIARSPEVLDDPEINAYLQGLAAKLTAPLGLQAPYVELFALRDPQINAFALPGGLIGINSGLVTAASNENELAGVVAHEIGHVEQRHIARSLAAEKEGSLWSLAALGVAILAARSNSASAANAMQAAVMGGQGLGLAQVLAFSRDAEREADRVGLNLLQGAGYDVSGLVGVFQKLQAQGRLYESGGPVYQRTHPLSTERIADLQNRTRTIPSKPPKDSLAFRLAQARYMLLSADTAEARNELRARLNARLAGNTPGEAAPSALAKVGAQYGLSLLDTAQRDATTARKSLEAAIKLAGSESTHPSFALAQARIEATSGDAAAARKTLTQLRNTFGPSTPHYGLVRDGCVDVLQFINAHDEAIALLREKNAANPQAGTWRLLAKSYAAKNDRMNQMRSQAEALALDGAWIGAVDAMRQARNAASGNFYAASEIDARLREFTVNAEEQRKENLKRGVPPERS